MEMSHNIPCICMKARRAANALTSYYDRLLEPIGVSTPQFSILINIYVTNTITMSELANTLHLDRSTLTRNVSLLVKEGYITTCTGKNRREINVSLTENGMETAESAYPLWLKAQADISNIIGSEEKASEFLRTLSMLQKIDLVEV